MALDGTVCQESSNGCLSWAVTLASLCRIVTAATSVSRSTPPPAQWHTTHSRVCWLSWVTGSWFLKTTRWVSSGSIILKKADVSTDDIKPHTNYLVRRICTTGMRKHAFLILGWTVPLMAHLSSNQYGRSGSSCIKAVFCSNWGPNEGSDWSLEQLAMQVSLVTQMEIFTESCVTWLNVRCLVRLFFAAFFFFFTHLLVWTKY